MIGSLDDMDEVEEGVLERIRATQLTKHATSLILDCVDQIVKTSFNGDRSAAGRHAAQIRWGNRGPKDLSERVAAMTAKSEAAATQHVVGDDPTDALYTKDGKEAWDDIDYYGARRDALGYGGPAQSATAEEADALVESGKFIVVYRGAPTANHDSYLTEHSDIGDGVMGHGMYTSPSYDRAEPYSKGSTYVPRYSVDQIRAAHQAGDNDFVEFMQNTNKRERMLHEMMGGDKDWGEVRAYLVPKAGLTAEGKPTDRLWTDAWGSMSEKSIHKRRNAAYGQSENYGNTDDLLIHNVSMLIQAPAGWRPKVEQSWQESHPWQ